MRALVFILVSILLGCSASDGGGGPGGRRDAGGGGGFDSGGGGSDSGGGGSDSGGGGSDSGGGGDERCNTYDDDGDGRVDEGCGCLPGTSQGCYPEDPDTLGVGACAGGTQGCEGSEEFGTWTECVGAVVPTEDDCGDRIDDDCNGTPDDGPECVCTPGETRACYTGPDGTRAVGICADGTQACNPVPGVGWDDCLDQVLPREEICDNGLDDDCNGATDDGSACACTAGTTRSCYSGPRAEIGVGICRAGTQMCVTGGTMWTMCGGEIGPRTETCNGVDDDCDGMIDEGCPTIVEVAVMLDGDCLTARCPPEAPYPVGCDIMMSGGDSRGCVASDPRSPVVYFQEGDACGAGHVTGTLSCSSEMGTGLNADNCMINKPDRFYPTDRSGCPDT